MSNWTYKTYPRWSNKYPQCSKKINKDVSPIDIRPKDIAQECGAKCEIVIKYKPSKCYLVNDHNTITINYEAGSYLVYQDNWYELTKIKIHTPSLHTINGEHFGAEMDLYHCSDKQCNTGIVLAILLDRGPDFGESVSFINQFINQSPLNSTPIEREVSVSNDWNAISLIPKDRTCYIYDGSLPHPPCTSGWKWIVFNQPSKIGTTALDVLQHNIIKRSGENIRPPFNFDFSKRSIYKIPHQWFLVFEERPIPTEEPVKVDDETANQLQNPNDSMVLLSKESSYDIFMRKNKSIIKNVLILIVSILFVVLAIKFCKIVIINDYINKFLTRKYESNSNTNSNNNSNNSSGTNNIPPPPTPTAPKPAPPAPKMASSAPKTAPPVPKAAPIPPSTPDSPPSKP